MVVVDDDVVCRFHFSGRRPVLIVQRISLQRDPTNTQHRISKYIVGVTRSDQRACMFIIAANMVMRFGNRFDVCRFVCIYIAKYAVETPFSPVHNKHNCSIDAARALF